MEYRFRRASDGAYRWFIGRANPLRDVDGRVARWFGSCTDIDDQKAAEEAVRQSDAKARLALDAARLGLWSWDPSTGRGSQDERAREIAGLGPDGPRTLAEGLVASVHPEDRAAVEAALRAAADPAGEGRLALEFRVRRPGGAVRWVYVTARTTFVGEGADRRSGVVVGTVEDVTAEKEAELALRRSQDRLHLALEGGGMGAWEWDVGTDGLAYDAQAAALWGVGPDALRTASDFLGVVHPGDLPDLQDTLEATLASGSRYAAEFRVVLPNGRTRWLAARGRVLRDDGGAAAHVLGLNFDVTERRETEETLRRKNAEMEQFAYTISHDLKSPLVTITGFLGVLKKHVDAGRTEKALAAADRVLGAADRMGRLIEDLLQLSRAGRVTGDPRPVDLDALVGGIASGLARRAAAAGGTLRTAGPLGAVLGDERRLGEVLENLLANAVTYGLGGGGTQIVVSSERAPGGGLRVVVADDGPGVPVAYRSKVFELFQRLDAGGDGTGIGLALVARIMEVLGGRAYVEGGGGPPGREGARFVLSFPASAVVERPPRGGVPSGDAPSGDPGADGGRPPASPPEPTPSSPAGGPGAAPPHTA